MDDESGESRSELTPELLELEAQVTAEPDSEELRDALLFAYCGQAALHGHPKRIEQILWHIRNLPRAALTHSPCAHVNPKISLTGFEIVRREWLQLHEQDRFDAVIACGYAAFVARADQRQAVEILQRVVDHDPSDAKVWLEMGRLSGEPREGLRCLQEARRLGSTHPNLLTWTASSALSADDRAAAATLGTELLSLANKARATYGDTLDWPENGAALWNRAKGVSEDRAAAHELVNAISSHARDKHWAHTTLGAVALRAGDHPAALEHLRESAEVVGSAPLRSYGPSLQLAEELCRSGYFSEVGAFLRACQRFWDAEFVEGWCAELAAGRTPEFVP
ncbi:MAG: hypothetical protein JWN04_673 [Myxococcaceae bacterium]|nr:hypothetical protein [Myxococcaceae bacterium]